jgi:hypothetical protein
MPLVLVKKDIHKPEHAESGVNIFFKAGRKKSIRDSYVDIE